jgi:hypothetical protein
MTTAPARLDEDARRHHHRPVNKTRRVTANLPEELLEDAMRMTGKGVTETLVTGLRLIRRRHAYDTAMALRGKARLMVDLDRSRER